VWRHSNAIISVRELADDVTSEVIENKRQPKIGGFRLSNRLCSRLGAQLENVVQTNEPVAFLPLLEDKPGETKSLEALPSLPKGQQHKEYLAGFVTFSALLVIVDHFTLTFVPHTVDPEAFTHNRGQTIAKSTISNFCSTSSGLGHCGRPQPVSLCPPIYVPAILSQLPTSQYEGLFVS